MYLVYESNCRDMYVNGQPGALVLITNSVEAVMRYLKKKKVNNYWKHSDKTHRFTKMIDHPHGGTIIEGGMSYIVKKED